MDSSQETTRNARRRGWPVLGLLLGLLAAGPVCYGVGLWAASLADGRGLNEVACFDPSVAHHASSTRLIIATVMAVGATLLLVVTPWTLGTLAIGRIQSKRATAGAWSLAANSAALVLACLVLRNTVGISRASFLVAWLAWAGVLFLALVLLLAHGKSARPAADILSAARRWGPGMAIGLGAVILSITLFHREQFVQCFNGDGSETFELARSLQLHFLPYFEIETTGDFGTVIVNPSLINSYWTCAWQVLLGEGELATRLPFWVWWLGIFAAALWMVQPGRPEGSWLPAAPLALLVILMGIWYTFYVGYNAYMTDLANPGVPDALYTLLLLLALDCLRRRDLAGWVALMALASLVLYAGPVMFVLTAAAALVWQPVPRGTMLRAALAGTAVLVGLVLFYLAWGWLDGSLWGWPSTLREEYFDEYFASGSRCRQGLLFAGYFLLGCGGIPTIGLLRVFGPRGWGFGARGSGLRRSPQSPVPSPQPRTPSPESAWQRTAASMTLLYLLIVLVSGYKNLHYLGPLLPVALILWLRRAEPADGRTIWNWAVCGCALAGLLVCICLCWPAYRPCFAPRPVFTLNRELGALTTFQTDSYEQASRWARITQPLYDRGLLSWQVGWHTWVGYSQLDAHPASPRPLLVTDQPPTGDAYGTDPIFQSPDGVRLYSRDPQCTRWLSSERPPGGSVRFPRILAPVAIEPRPRGGVP